MSATDPAMVRRDYDRYYAIGDVHGRADLLDRLAKAIAEDIARVPVAKALTVFLGDYIDRGPDSSAVIERLQRRRFPTPIVTLRGNHEQMLLDGLIDPDAFSHWLASGGDATMLSYAGSSIATVETEFFTAETLRALMPQSHDDFLRATLMSFDCAHHFFCHAGIRPGVPLEAQRSQDLLWIRQPFHTSREDFGKVIVHGHTPVLKPESLPNRINVDTGAFKTGVLTCAVLQGDSRRFLSVRGY